MIAYRGNSGHWWSCCVGFGGIAAFDPIEGRFFQLCLALAIAGRCWQQGGACFFVLSSSRCSFG